jgi:hypothetical protein
MRSRHLCLFALGLAACPVSPRDPGDLYTCQQKSDCPSTVPNCCDGICSISTLCAPDAGADAGPADAGHICNGPNNPCGSNADCCSPAECAVFDDGGGNCCVPGGQACSEDGAGCCNLLNHCTADQCDPGAGVPCTDGGTECGSLLTCALVGDVGTCE